MKTIIEIHALQNFAPSNLNRDDSGAPKDALFGGTRRARISSQCLKRAVREYFGQKKDGGFFTSEELAVRTKRVYQAIAEALKDKRKPEEVVVKAEIALSYVKLKSAGEGKSQYLLFLGQKEIAGLADVIHKHWDQVVPVKEEGDGAGKKSKSKEAAGAPKEVKDKMEAIFNGGKAVDLALFGRMLAGMPEKNQDAACQVAHAISTHAVEREFDFYTAVDDLKPEDAAGADMMGTVEFNSACFYRYAVVDWAKLLGNLQNDSELSMKGLRAFLEGFIVAEPTGKQNTFAAHNPPEFVAISVRRDSAPRSLANAFEKAVYIRKGDSVTEKSAEELVKKAIALRNAFGGEEKIFILNLTGANSDDLGVKVSALRELLDKVCAEVKG